MLRFTFDVVRGLLVFAALFSVSVFLLFVVDWASPWVTYPIIVWLFIWLIVWAVRSDWKADRYPNRME